MQNEKFDTSFTKFLKKIHEQHILGFILQKNIVKTFFRSKRKIMTSKKWRILITIPRVSVPFQPPPHPLNWGHYIILCIMKLIVRTHISVDRFYLRITIKFISDDVCRYGFRPTRQILSISNNFFFFFTSLNTLSGGLIYI